MSKWSQMYADKLTTPAEAMKDINDGDKVWASGGSSTPAALMDALFDRAPELRDVKFGSYIMLAPTAKVMQPELQRNILIDNYYATPLDRGFLAAGLMTHSPYNFHQLSRTATVNGRLPQAPDADRPHGRERLPQPGHLRQLPRRHRTAGRYLRRGQRTAAPHPRPEQYPHLAGEKVVESHHPVFAMPPAPIEETDLAIAENIIDLIEDGSHRAAGHRRHHQRHRRAAAGKKHLGCHSEMINDAYMKLFEAGALDGSLKNVHRFQMNSFFALGSQELYKWMDDNPMIYFTPSATITTPTSSGRTTTSSPSTPPSPST